MVNRTELEEATVRLEMAKREHATHNNDWSNHLLGLAEKEVAKARVADKRSELMKRAADELKARTGHSLTNVYGPLSRGELDAAAENLVAMRELLEAA